MFILGTILLAVDSRFMRTHLKRILHESHFKKIIEAENSIYAIDLYKVQSPDIVLLDLLTHRILCPSPSFFFFSPIQTLDPPDFIPFIHLLE